MTLRSVAPALLALTLSACANASWQGDKAYVPPEVDNIALVGFNVDAEVALLRDGTLPITVSRDLFNNGRSDLQAGYQVQEEAILTVFAVQGGAAAFEVADLSLQTVFRCRAPGPAIPAGGSARVSFTFPGPNCQQLNPAAPPAAPLAALPCGLYREVLTIDPDNRVIEASERDNVAVHYFQVPSPVQQLTIATTRNPNNNPRIAAGPGPDEVTVRFDVMPSPEVTHRHVINATPAGSTFIARAPTPIVTRTAGDRLTVAPAPLGALPNGVTGPQTVSVMMAPNANFVGPQTDILSGAFVEKIVSGLTAITTDGCLVRQASHPVSVLHPATP